MTIAETSLRLAAEVHKRVRRDLRDQRIIRAGAKFVDIADFIETATKMHASDIIDSSSESNTTITTINGGIGFPVGISVNECAAHYHPDSIDDSILSVSDVVKIDFGTEINGWIIDSAFTERVSFYPANATMKLKNKLNIATNINYNTINNPNVIDEEQYEVLAKCMRESTDTGIRNIGIDVPVLEWSQSVEEVMKSYDVHPISNLGGHNILHEVIHGNMFLPGRASSVRDPRERFAEGVYAIETFGSTDANLETDCEAREKGAGNIYRLNPGFMRYTAAQLAVQFRSPIFKIQSVQRLFSQIKTRFKTLPFAERYMNSCDRTPLSLLVKHDVLYCYPPLRVERGVTAQFEHTIMLNDGGTPVTVFSRDDDY
jgi:methionyl aminopeptidase